MWCEGSFGGCLHKHGAYRLRHGDSIVLDEIASELLELRRSAARGIAVFDMMLDVV